MSLRFLNYNSQVTMGEDGAFGRSYSLTTVANLNANTTPVSSDGYCCTITFPRPEDESSQSSSSLSSSSSSSDSASESNSESSNSSSSPSSSSSSQNMWTETLDLTALPVDNFNTKDFTGYSLLLIKFKAASTNVSDIEIAAGVSNGLNVTANFDVTLKAGQEVTLYLGSTGPTINSSNRILSFAGDHYDELNVVIAVT